MIFFLFPQKIEFEMSNPGFWDNKKSISKCHLQKLLPNILSVKDKDVSYLPYYSDRQAWANNVDPDERLQNAASHQGLHCLPLIQQFLGTTCGSKLYLFKI